MGCSTLSVCVIPIENQIDQYSVGSMSRLSARETSDQGHLSYSVGLSGAEDLVRGRKEGKTDLLFLNLGGLSARSTASESER